MSLGPSQLHSPRSREPISFLWAIPGFKAARDGTQPVAYVPSSRDGLRTARCAVRQWHQSSDAFRSASKHHHLVQREVVISKGRRRPGKVTFFRGAAVHLGFSGFI